MFIYRVLKILLIEIQLIYDYIVNQYYEPIVLAVEKINLYFFFTFSGNAIVQHNSAAAGQPHWPVEPKQSVEHSQGIASQPADASARSLSTYNLIIKILCLCLDNICSKTSEQIVLIYIKRYLWNNMIVCVVEITVYRNRQIYIFNWVNVFVFKLNGPIIGNQSFVSIIKHLSCISSELLPTIVDYTLSVAEAHCIPSQQQLIHSKCFFRLAQQALINQPTAEDRIPASSPRAGQTCVHTRPQSRLVSWWPKLHAQLLVIINTNFSLLQSLHQMGTHNAHTERKAILSIGIRLPCDGNNQLNQGVEAQASQLCAKVLTNERRQSSLLRSAKDKEAVRVV